MKGKRKIYEKRPSPWVDEPTRRTKSGKDILQKKIIYKTSEPSQLLMKPVMGLSFKFL